MARTKPGGIEPMEILLFSWDRRDFGINVFKVGRSGGRQPSPCPTCRGRRGLISLRGNVSRCASHPWADQRRAPPGLGGDDDGRRIPKRTLGFLVDVDRIIRVDWDGSKAPRRATLTRG